MFLYSKIVDLTRKKLCLVLKLVIQKEFQLLLLLFYLFLSFFLFLTPKEKSHFSKISELQNVCTQIVVYENLSQVPYGLIRIPLKGTWSQNQTLDTELQQFGLQSQNSDQATGSDYCAFEFWPPACVLAKGKFHLKWSTCRCWPYVLHLLQKLKPPVLST